MQSTETKRDLALASTTRTARGRGQLSLMEAPREAVLSRSAAKRAIEAASFPFEHLSDVAELESWRKEIHRPVYHLHKWWAQRLGSVFRAMVIGTFAPGKADVLRLFHEPVRIPGAIIFDPFMGSGTTIGETLKLGARAIGRDINPVSYFMVRNALASHTRTKVIATFRAIEHDVARTITRFYQARLSNGDSVDVLYYFWVKVLACPRCQAGVDLFSSYIFSQHVYPGRFPEARAVCPDCGAVNRINHDVEHAVCAGCKAAFSPNRGPARGTQATCPQCHFGFPIAKSVKATGEPPAHRLYAKMVLLPSGEKEYVAADDFDRDLYTTATRELSERRDAFPVVKIEPGYNTNQALNYGYQYWHQMFNARQLLCLSILAERIRAIPEESLRDLFTCLFSGVLEFNNMFASFKGEGTGAVRHMFSHHILKPERTPLEANLWGTRKSSGSFTTLFESRLLRALDYNEDPSEIRPVRKNGKLTSEKVYGLSRSIGHEAAASFLEFQQGKALYLSCGDSATTDLPSESVDAVITDPPFFDNVHYSQLADFFHVWQRFVVGEHGAHAAHTTRSDAEVQQTDPEAFASRLQRVWRECYRVLKPDGMLVFSYHHSRTEGWRCVFDALMGADFTIVATHPIKAEMSVAAPKHQAREPIDLDIILVCRKRSASAGGEPDISRIVRDAEREAASQIARLRGAGRTLSRNDIRVVVMAQVIRRLSQWPYSVALAQDLARSASVAEEVITRLGDLQPSQEGVAPA